MAWRRPGDKPLSEPMMVSLLTHICVTRPQWVNKLNMVRTENDSAEKKRQHLKLWFFNSKFNSVWPSDAIWRYRSGLTLAEVIPNSTKSLPEPMLTYHERYSVVFTWEQFHKCSKIALSELLPHIPRANELKCLYQQAVAPYSSEWRLAMIPYELCTGIVIFVSGCGFQLCPYASRSTTT